jgi:phosphatidylserine/phosphatidylglycerophosphate/cardiolipin synthase-like enzyme
MYLINLLSVIQISFFSLTKIDIHFYGLYQHAKLGNKHVAAQIYVHSKVMINDTTAIVGSGNINHRRFVKIDKKSKIGNQKSKIKNQKSKIN